MRPEIAPVFPTDIDRPGGAGAAGQRLDVAVDVADGGQGLRTERRPGHPNTEVEPRDPPADSAAASSDQSRMPCAKRAKFSSQLVQVGRDDLAHCDEVRGTS